MGDAINVSWSNNTGKVIIIVLIIAAILGIAYYFFGNSVFGSKSVYDLQLKQTGEDWAGTLNVPQDFVMGNKNYTFFIDSIISSNPSDMTGTTYNLQLISPTKGCQVTFRTSTGQDSSSISTTPRWPLLPATFAEVR